MKNGVNNLFFFRPPKVQNNRSLSWHDQFPFHSLLLAMISLLFVTQPPSNAFDHINSPITLFTSVNITTSKKSLHNTNQATS